MYENRPPIILLTNFQNFQNLAQKIGGCRTIFCTRYHNAKLEWISFSVAAEAGIQVAGIQVAGIGVVGIHVVQYVMKVDFHYVFTII